MSEVREWLEAIGLVQYADAFEANDIDIDLLGQVDDQMLKDIGVSSAGHRLRIRNAIAKLSPASPLAKNENATSAATEPKTQDVAERRQVTVMFSDLVGSTALSARMDPEDLREVISAYQKCVAETVQRFGGFVAKYMGDGVLVYFGYPASPRGRCRAGGAGGAGIDPSGARVEVHCFPTNPCRHCDRPGRRWRPDRDRVRLRNRRLSARRRTLPHACRGLPSRTRSSSRRARENCSAIFSSWKTSGQRTSRA